MHDTAYRIGVWCKGRNAGISNIGGGPGWALRIPLPRGSFDWIHVEGLYLTGPAENAFELMLFSESATDALWIDDVSITEDPTKTRDLLAQREKRASAIEALPKTLEQQLARQPYRLPRRHRPLRSPTCSSSSWTT